MMGRLSLKEKSQPTYKINLFSLKKWDIQDIKRLYWVFFIQQRFHFHPLAVTVPGFGCKPKEGFPLLSATSQGVMLKAYYRI